ncbi:MAG: polynucleotide adenylyltransferase PcnB [Planctomycetota bacterium]
MVDAQRIARPDHPVSRSLIDEHVVRVLYRLKKLGYQAYVVGGAVRDILQGKRPKDFDIATDATPSELRKLFRNSRIVGRRFRLVHLLFGDEMVEVATLRRQIDSDESDDDLYIEEDNAWGDVESDAFRRDFTINALYYDINDFSLIDYVGGVDDLEQHLIRSIGDPWTRFGEDPVRMLRAIKFAARFGYRIETETDGAMRDLPDEILKASRFRVTEEIFRILTQANRDLGLRMLADYGLLTVLFPTWLQAIGDDGFDQVVEYFERVESEAREGRHLPLELIAAGLFLPLLGTIDPEQDPYHECASALAGEIRDLCIEMDLPKRLSASITTLLRGQLYMLYFAARPKQMKRFVTSHEFDWIWRLHDIAFGHITALHPLQESWLATRERLPHAIDGWTDRPDRRDVFSFRGKTGGGRRDEQDSATILGDHQPASTGRRRSRRRRRH